MSESADNLRAATAAVADGRLRRVGSAGSPVTPVPLRRRLFALIAVGILPLALLAGIGLVVLERQQNAQTESVGLELSRSVANAVDAELRSVIEILETFTTTPTLEARDLAGFRERAMRVLEVNAEWAAITLADQPGERQ